MNLTVTIANQLYRVHTELAESIAIPMTFTGEQPNHFGVEPAIATTLEVDGFVGNTARGGSCNVDEIRMIPHCNGTHTETAGHIVNDDVFISRAVEDSLIPARVVSVTPKAASQISDGYVPNREDADLMIDKQSLVDALKAANDEEVVSLVIRTLPNYRAKNIAHYGSENGQVMPPFISVDAMEYILERGVRHLLVDIPSIDKMHDEGHLTCHHMFWNIPLQTHEVSSQNRLTCTITEMVFVPDYLDDGLYLLNLQVPAMQIDAVPSRPMLMPLSLIDSSKKT